MGTWGDGLYDNDSVLDGLGHLLDELDLESSGAHLIVGLGLLAWMATSSLIVHPERFRGRIDAHRAWIDASPAAVREKIAALYENPEAFEDLRSRPEPVRAALGGYCNGPREDVLLTVAGHEAVIEAFAERCRERLDELAGTDLYEISGELAPLGVLVELRVLGVESEPARIAQWRAAFERSNENTDDEREFFDGYVDRVRLAFDLLA